ncbi:hypothetical protein AMTRI_Chr10g5330 [Amborella trichopoda]|uniref:WAT1-related protein n=1 Tax=Amborella trichopoda TaxID=13333 RepID=U5CY44_AMBTC|nr:WAT1-related protein At4g30420 [Amborella trichopoda]ERN18271.1 hypothetical protein AMTR_s00055p00139380 [Amborella trichopoda]|eukprot:XP_006856804.1 WAT1-related protein At4g30420 [Amborella trichopoda]
MGDHGPLFAQLLFQTSLAVMYLITRLAFEQGMSRFIFVTYRQAVATVVISPIAYFLDRNSRPPLNMKTLCHIFVLALFGVPLSQTLYFTGLYYTSSTFAATIMNLIPAIAFVAAFLLRMEKINVRSSRGLAKVCGTFTCVGGAMIMTLIKGPSIEFFKYFKSPKSILLFLDSGSHLPSVNWTLGPILLVSSVSAYSTWIIYQAWVFKDYPAPLSLTAMTLVMGTFQSGVVSFLFERSKEAWELHWDFQLFTYVYSGIMCSALAFLIQSWCIKNRGPVFAAAFNPLCTVLVAIIEPTILHVDIYAGRVVGMALVISGLYSLLWGKANDGVGKKVQTEDQVESNKMQFQEESYQDLEEPLLEVVQV